MGFRIMATKSSLFCIDRIAVLTFEQFPVVCANFNLLVNFSFNYRLLLNDFILRSFIWARHLGWIWTALWCYSVDRWALLSVGTDQIVCTVNNFALTEPFSGLICIYISTWIRYWIVKRFILGSVKKCMANSLFNINWQIDLFFLHRLRKWKLLMGLMEFHLSFDNYRSTGII